MSAFIRCLPAAAALLPWVVSLATWLLARALNMPHPWCRLGRIDIHCVQIIAAAR